MARERSRVADEAETEYGDLKQVAQAVKEKAAERRAERAQEAGGAGAMPRLLPMPGDDAAIDAQVEADLNLETAAAQIREQSEEVLRKLTETYVVYVRCPVKHPRNRPPHALYLSEYPRGIDVPADKWYSRQKPKAEDPFYPLDVFCQTCLLEGTHTSAKVAKTSADGALRVEPRHLFRYPKDPARFKVEGITRVFNTAHASANEERLKAMQRARDAGFEVYEE